MQKEKLISGLDKVAHIATVSKLHRMLLRPYKYVHAILFRDLYYKFSKQEKQIECKTFFGSQMQVLLPSSSDIYITGGKSHHSEIRLAKLMINRLSEGDCFLDIGAHYGYFSLLASVLVGSSGTVISIEAAPKTFAVLQNNKAHYKSNAVLLNAAVSDNNNEMTFYEFPNYYSEFNTLDDSQFKDAAWTKNNQPKQVQVQAVMLDTYLLQNNLQPTFVKIDVEGAELQVLQGATTFLANNNPMLVMEYLCAARKNESHKKAAELLYQLGFQSYLILDNGDLALVSNIDNHFSENNIDSDNVVFAKIKE